MGLGIGLAMPLASEAVERASITTERLGVAGDSVEKLALFSTGCWLNGGCGTSKRAPCVLRGFRALPCWQGLGEDNGLPD
mmetsp:Transcript_52666/g.112644  ORF Transcript_52666/g.112644 Transcript_52666/m.112644 type:complete len:80 (+) Transcript_52666:1231-1470(+)